MNMSYSCIDIEATCAESLRRRIDFHAAPENQPKGTFAIFRDSEGHRFVISGLKRMRSVAARSAKEKHGPS
jgi:hypothetical protein